MYWYEDKNAERGVYVSSRVRLARNFADYTLEPRLDKTGASEIIEKVKKDLCSDPAYTFTDFSALDENQKYSMVDKHLVSPEMAEKKTPSAIVENQSDGVVVMICEEDHLRIQSIRAGLDLDGAYKACCEADDKIDAAEKIAYDDTLGYLTHCPTNLGTGMRASVMMFLPALTLTGRIRGLSHQLSALGLTVRGVTGDKRVAVGFIRLRETGHSSEFSEGLKSIFAPRKYFMDITLVSNVKKYSILRWIKNPVQSHSKLDYAKVGGQMSSGLGYVFQQEAAYIRAESCHLALFQAFYVIWMINVIKYIIQKQYLMQNSVLQTPRLSRLNR